MYHFKSVLSHSAITVTTSMSAPKGVFTEAATGKRIDMAYAGSDTFVMLRNVESYPATL